MTYSLVKINGEHGIWCLICDRVSRHPDDIRNLYCAGCQAFHSQEKGALSPYPPHRCHAIGCERKIDPKFLMCPPHWRMVPKEIQRGIWRHYRAGQEIDKRPSAEYLVFFKKAQLAVSEAEAMKKRGGSNWIS